MYTYQAVSIKKIETQVESDFGIGISKISKIKYRFVPSPHLVLERFNLSLDEKKDSLIASPENSKIYVPFFNLYKKVFFKIFCNL